MSYVINFVASTQFVATANFSSNFSSNATVGSDATFECKLGTINPSIGIGYYSFQYNLTINDTSMEVWHAYCPIGRTVYCMESIQIHIPYQFTNISTYNYTAEYRFFFTVINVNETYNDSSFSCSIVSDGQTQWKRTTHLNISLYNDSIDKRVTVVATSVFVVLLCGAMVVAVLGGILATKRFKAASQRSSRINPDQGN